MFVMQGIQSATYNSVVLYNSVLDFCVWCVKIQVSQTEKKLNLIASEQASWRN
jgi:hypothetical protein